MTVGGGFYNLFKGYTWLRSGARNPSDNARYLSSYGAYYYTFPARRFSVRPATHKAVGLFYCHPEARRRILIFRSFTNAQDDKVENNVLQYCRRRFFNLLGCVPGLILMPTILNTCLLRERITVLTMHVGFLCGLRFT